jgi:hypothetical protein
VADWDRVMSEMGPEMTCLDVYPPRWAVETFPTADQMQRMGAEPIGDHAGDET